MTKVTIACHAHLGRYLPDGAPHLERAVELRPGETLGEVLLRLGVPAAEVLMMLDGAGRRLDRDHRPVDGERIELLPALSGG